MSIVKNWGVILVIAAAMTGCGQEHNHKGKTPLVEAVRITEKLKIESGYDK